MSFIGNLFKKRPAPAPEPSYGDGMSPGDLLPEHVLGTAYAKMATERNPVIYPASIFHRRTLRWHLYYREPYGVKTLGEYWTPSTSHVPPEALSK